MGEYRGRRRDADDPDFPEDTPAARFVEALYAHEAPQKLRPLEQLDKEKLVYKKTMEDNAAVLKGQLVEPDRQEIDEIIVRLRGGVFVTGPEPSQSPLRLPSPLPSPSPEIAPSVSMSAGTVRSFHPSPSLLPIASLPSSLPQRQGSPRAGVEADETEEKIGEVPVVMPAVLVRKDGTPIGPVGEMEAGPEPKKGYSNMQFLAFGAVLAGLAYITDEG